MVHLAPLSLAAMSLLTLAAATPTAATTEPVFSFAKWVDDVVTNPETALSPEEAWQAYLDTANSTTSVPVAARGGVEKRWDPEVSCNNYDPGPAWAPDAVWCINNLAAKGSTACVAGSVTYFCTRGRARITGVYSPPSGRVGQTSSCQQVAQSAGRIMDTCTAPNQYVEGSRMNINPETFMAVHIRAP
ncbi:hypothetical protein SMACR_00300 [Sordaria macrospora]|uniref:WGS project CABT00000000 data, contig 2.1 n=2 Tax=Sordaria macrospora TaxID=5147 RepID=F7VKQ6_SORMK|nr:uncharacterized protein SMAC_00300 [Sordaria macrospora k-hell]KAA8636872.1 hypothetical protein SMACR_00300 [Sordaria macrospora]KAH7634147.1 hypothetical protein B0T09DRAFT_312 [Sordaria sp. MPI-SDFR-AT-0083]WPJ59045.1 hypothetical protein SMAC4_00300 [Sordaria macrospora]CCC06083.1 unnamed protein product [Sordaria macrospora k-hell]